MRVYGEKDYSEQEKMHALIDTRAIWATVVMLVAFGLIMIYSTSAVQLMRSISHKNDSLYLLKRQFVFAAAGLVVCFIFQFVNYTIIYKMAKYIYLGSIISIILLKTSLGVHVKGATRWLNIAGVQFQVAELVKYSVVIILAFMIQRHAKYLGKMRLTFRIWLVGGGAGILLMIISNDLSSSLVILGITFGVSFVCTDNNKIHYFIVGITTLIIGTYIWKLMNNLPTVDELNNSSFRIGRMVAWLNPEKYAKIQGYQTLQALYAIGNGGFFGKGLGNSIQKLGAIPEAQNDMFFSIICEELGALGAIVLILLIGYLCYLMMRIAFQANDLFGSVLVIGVLFHISLQSIINIGVNLNVFPNTGIGLPFVSYGGTAVFFQLLEIAIVLSVGRVS